MPSEYWNMMDLVFGGQNPKGILSDDILLDGTVIKKGAYSMGRMTELWGPDAQEFQPERALAQRGCINSPLHPPSKFTASFSGSSTHELLHFFECYIS
jgi:hypothetical protein